MAEPTQDRDFIKEAMALLSENLIMSPKLITGSQDGDDEYLSELSELEHKLHMARYAFHMVKLTRYAEMVQSGLMPMAEGAEHYRRSMENYDKLIAEDGDGHLTEADQASMDKGFVF